MAHWFQQFLLIVFSLNRVAAKLLLLLQLLLLLVLPGLALHAAELETNSSAPVLPDLTAKAEKPVVAEAAIDNEIFELGVFAGVLAIEDFENSVVSGVSASFHATEDFFLQFNLGRAEGGDSTAEYFFGDDDVNIINDRNYRYYDLLLGYNLFPGEVFIHQGLTLNSSFYLTLGAGSTDFADDEHFTLTFGSGYRVILNDWLSLAVDFRDHSFNQQIGARDKRVHNLEFSTSARVFF